jgi:hypothetical protein
VNAIRALNSGYERLDFKVMHVYTDHSTGKNNINLYTIIDNQLVTPENQLVTSRDYNVGTTVKVWYNPETNMIAQHFMTNVIMNFVSAGLAVATIFFTLPRKKKTTGG